LQGEILTLFIALCQQKYQPEGNPSVLGGCAAKAGQGEREEKGNAKAQGRREEEENEKDSVVACRGMGILPMIPTRAECCRLCNAGVSPAVPRASRPRQGQDVLQRNTGQPAGGTMAPLRALRTLRSHP